MQCITDPWFSIKPTSKYTISIDILSNLKELSIAHQLESLILHLKYSKEIEELIVELQLMMESAM